MCFDKIQLNAFADKYERNVIISFNVNVPNRETF